MDIAFGAVFLADGLFADTETAAAFSTDKTLSRFKDYELALTRALGAEGLIEQRAIDAIIAAAQSFTPDTDAIRTAVNRDGLPVPEYVRQFKAHVGEPHASSFHKGSTSQDLIDTALVLALGEAGDTLKTALSRSIAGIADLQARFGTSSLMGRTRMQAALPITVADRLDNWLAPLRRQHDSFDAVMGAVQQVQYGGPVGISGGDTEKGKAVAKRIAADLGLNCPGKPWHTERDNLVGFSNWLSLVTGHLGKIGQDVCLMSQQGIDEIAVSRGGHSSAMPHKQNPILAETLVTLARFNAVQVSGMHHALVHEQERSGAAWPLEWLILPQMCTATGAALKRAGELLAAIEHVGER